MLGQILELQQGLIVSNGEDIELLVEATSSYHVLAQLMAEIGSRDEAISMITRSRDIALDVIAREPDRLEHTATLCVYENDRAMYLTAQGRAEEARAIYQSIVPRMEKLADAELRTEGTNRHFNLARICINLGVMERRAGRLDSAEQPYLKALQANQVCLDRAPCNDYWDTQAMCLNSLSVVQEKTSRRAEAIASVEDSIRIRRQLVENVPGYTPYMKGLASSNLNLAIYLEKDPKPEAAAGAAAAYRAAIEVQARLVELHPELTDQRTQLGKLWKDLAGFYRQRGQVGEAAGAYREACAAYAKLARQQPEIWLPLSEWADCCRLLAGLVDKEPEPLVVELEEILGRLKRWQGDASTRDKGEALASAIHLAAATLLERTGKTEDAVRHRNAATRQPATGR